MRIFVVSLLLSLLVCGIVAAEFPELMSLTDNTSNDFTVGNRFATAAHVLPSAGKPIPNADMDCKVTPSTLSVSRLSSFERATLPAF